MKFFNKDGFINYLHNNFNGFENGFLRETVENIIDYAEKNENTSKDQFVYFISDILPEIEFSEVAMFCADDILTDYGKSEKKRKLNKEAAK